MEDVSFVQKSFILYMLDQTAICVTAGTVEGLVKYVGHKNTISQFVKLLMSLLKLFLNINGVT